MPKNEQPPQGGNSSGPRDVQHSDLPAGETLVLRPDAKDPALGQYRATNPVSTGVACYLLAAVPAGERKVSPGYEGAKA